MIGGFVRDLAMLGVGSAIGGVITYVIARVLQAGELKAAIKAHAESCRAQDNYAGLQQWMLEMKSETRSMRDALIKLIALSGHSEIIEITG